MHSFPFISHNKAERRDVGTTVCTHHPLQVARDNQVTVFAKLWTLRPVLNHLKINNGTVDSLLRMYRTVKFCRPSIPHHSNQHYPLTHISVTPPPRCVLLKNPPCKWMRSSHGGRVNFGLWLLLAVSAANLGSWPQARAFHSQRSQTAPQTWIRSADLIGAR